MIQDKPASKEVENEEVIQDKPTSKEKKLVTLTEKKEIPFFKNF